MLHYPVEFPADAAKVILTNFASGSLVSNAPAVAECAWNIAGYGLGQTLGESQGGNLSKAGPDVEPMSDEDALDALNAGCDKDLRAGILSSLVSAQLVKWAINLAFKVLAGIDPGTITVPGGPTA